MGWEVKTNRWRIKNGKGIQYLARNPDSNQPSARKWHFVGPLYLLGMGIKLPRLRSNKWEVNWSHPENTGTFVMARNVRGHTILSRKWHLVATGYLRKCGIKTPVYRGDSWQVDWNSRKGKLVLARNPSSKMPSAREWHFVCFHTLQNSGIPWRPKKAKMGSYVNKQGYVIITRSGMTADEIVMAETHGLFRGSGKLWLLEHRLVALKKFGSLPTGSVVRHLNGIKTDNSPENLVLGTTQDNTRDHNTARLMAMYWKNQYDILKKQS